MTKCYSSMVVNKMAEREFQEDGGWGGVGVK